MNSRVVFAAVLTSVAAYAQTPTYCPVDPAPKTQFWKCDPALRGDPVSMVTGRTLDDVTDFTLTNGDDRFAFHRYFSSSGATTQLPTGFGGTWPVGMMAPFGRVGSEGPRWLHSLHSEIYHYSTTNVLVLAPELFWTEFESTCFTPSPCFLRPYYATKGTSIRLQRLGLPSDRRYILIREDGEHWRYEPDPSEPSVSRLTQVEDRLGRVRYSLTYGEPDGCPSFAGSARYLQSAVFRNGARLKFSYSEEGPTGSACVIKTVQFESGPVATPSTSTLVTYSYDPTAKTISAVTPAFGPQETYSETAAAWDAVRGGVTRTHHFFDANLRVSESSGERDTTNFQAAYPGTIAQYLGVVGHAASSSSCLQDNLALYPVDGISPGAIPAPSVVNEVTKTLRYFGYADATSSGGKHGESVGAQCVAGATPGTCAPGTITEFVRLGSLSASCANGEGVSSLIQRPATTTPSRFENETTWRVPAGTQGVTTYAWGDTVPMYKAKGGSSFVGPLTATAVPLANALETTFYNDGYYGTTFGYLGLYDDNGAEPSFARRFDSHQRPSTLDSNARTDERLEGEIRFGSSKDIKSGNTKRQGTVQSATRKTLNFTSRLCGATDAGTAPSPDASSRILRVEGPCWWDAATGACESSQQIPLTEYHYHDSQVVGFKAGRLRYVKRYPNRSGVNCGAPLTTEFADYDAEGRPLTVVDEAGVTTTYTYSLGRIASRTVGSNTTTYVYEPNGELRYIGYPQGNFLVFCRHANSSTFCDFTAALLPKLQWVAKSGSNSGASPSEKVTYEYGFGLVSSATQGPLKHQRFYDSAGQLRRQLSSFRDADFRITYESSGTSPTGVGSVVSTRNIDVTDNVAALGGRFEGAPSLCEQSPGTLSPLCVWFTNDRANRLAQVDSNPTGAVSTTESIRTCLDYDQQGNVRRVAQGCNSTATCNVDKSLGAQSNCVNSLIDYEVDDFGDTVEVKGGWKGDTATGRSLTRYEYNARGLVTKKETETMRGAGVWLKYTYDAADRLVSLTKEGVGGSVLLYYLGYDGGNPGTSCPTLNYQVGRLAYRSDSFGVTWYGYDAEGRITQELRQRAGSQGSCAWGGSPYINNPSTVYTYSANGNLTSIQYPYGRTITYIYGSGGKTDRVSAISTTYWDNATPSTVNIVGGVAWEPFGGLRSYWAMTGPAFGTKTPVEYFKGTLASGDTQETSQSGISCVAPAGAGQADGTGRTRALFVGSNGSLLRQVYTWTADQLARQQTCVGRLGQTTETSQSFTYDKTKRLTGTASTGFAQITAPVNPGSNRTYGYDRRGNRTTYSTDGCSRSIYYQTGDRDEIFNYMAPQTADPECNGRFSGPTIQFDADGRGWRKGTAYWWWYADLNYVPNGLSSGLDSVMKSVTVNRSGAAPTTFNYRYDAFNRRRMKTYPFDSEEEFFYDSGQQLLAQRSGNVVGMATEWTVDDYIWLDGMPVAMVRGSFSSSFARNLDTQAACNRFGEPGACGIYDIVNDYLPKPVLMLHALTGKVANVALYDDFGDANRVPVIAGTGLPAASTMIADVQLPTGSATQYTARALYNILDIPAGVSATINGGASVSATSTGQVWSPWSTISTTNPIQVRLNSTVCGSQCNRQGVQTDAIEYRRFEAGVVPMWTTLRLPGQQFDQETDLFENWNRYLDATTGRYLSPEPMLQSPDYVSSMAYDGLSVPTYAYALNNPLRYSDQTGLGAEEWGSQGIRQAGEAVKLVVITGGAGAASGGAGGAAATAAGGVLVVGGVVVGSAAVAATVVVGNGQFPDPGAGTPGPGASSPTPNAPQPHPPGEPGCPNPTGKSCSEQRAEARKICEDLLMTRGLSRTKAKEICWVCASVDYSYCIGNIQRAMELALRCENALKKAGQPGWR